MGTSTYNELKLITNNEESSFYTELLSNLNACNRFYFSVAFISFSGLQLLLDAFKEAEKKNVKGQVIASTYLNFTDTKSLKKLKEFSNIDTKIYITDSAKGFHTKGYIFEYDDYYKILVGSSNITQTALKSNIEWNVRYISKTKSDSFVNEVIHEYNQLWEHTEVLNEEFIDQYESFLNEVNDFVKKEKEIFDYKLEIKENPMQKKALENLESLRKNSQKKALVVAATGTGKTYLSAFDVKKMGVNRVLFLVHREVILNDAIKSFKNIMPEKIVTKFQGTNKVLDAEITFAMVPTMYNNGNYKLFSKDHFDYIIADEAHRAFSDSYKMVLDYFEPKFLLGMTATPERTDHGNIFEMFNNNIALEIRLRDALKEDLVIPFHYFGIKDVKADLKDIDISKIDEVAKRLSIKERVDFIIEKMLHYEHSGSKRKCLGFCATKDHAKYMAQAFDGLGYPSVALTGESSDDKRKQAIKRLEDPNDILEFIFTIDIFNEGIDIPSVNLVLMLRPTQSPIIFTQQLGRGLRKHLDKEFLTVIDFIGNHNKTFLIPIALSGTRYYEKDSLKIQVHNDFSDIPGCSNIYLDQIAKEDILRQLDKANFNSMEYLKKEYQEFRKILGGRKPKLIDYTLYDSAPDPTKFVVKENSYEEFGTKMEKEDLGLRDYELSILRTLDKSLPIKRINEFVILKHLFQYGEITLETAKQNILKFVVDVDEESIKHSFMYFSGYILGNREKDPYDFIEGDGKRFLELKDKSLINNQHFIETLNYGIIRFQEEFGKDKVDYPYLKLYYPYKMKDMGFLTNYTKSFSSIRGAGVWRNGNHFYLFVDLHKDEDIKESTRYDDKLISRKRMQWETQNKTTQDSKVGMDICLNQSRGINLHMFIRKAKKIGTQTLDYIYVGKVNPIEYHGNAPIKLLLEFEQTLPKYLYDDLTLNIK